MAVDQIILAEGKTFYVVIILAGSVQSLDPLGHQGDMRKDSAEIPFRSFLQEALVSSSGTPL